jgi:hypothetical protein
MHAFPKPINTVHRMEPGRRQKEAINSKNNVIPHYELTRRKNYIHKNYI